MNFPVKMAALRLSGVTILLSSLGVPVFVWANYEPYTGWAYQTGIVWRILTVSVLAGLTAATVSTFAAKRLLPDRRKGIRLLLAASAGPSVVFLPSIWIFGGAAGGPGLAFVTSMTIAACPVFWIVVLSSLQGVSAK